MKLEYAKASTIDPKSTFTFSQKRMILTFSAVQGARFLTLRATDAWLRQSFGAANSSRRRFCQLAMLCFLFAACETPTTPDPTLSPTTHRFENRDAWKLENDRLRISILHGGGHIAEVVLKGDVADSVNPLWVPPWPSIEPWTFDVERHGRVYGTNAEASLLSGIMGHNLCFDFWGTPSAAESRAGIAYHGEASILRAEMLTREENSLTHRLSLKESGTSITRTMTLVPGQSVLYVEETAENHTSLDRPFGWVQHATFGPPFVHPETVYFDASATHGDLGGDTFEPLGTWPVGSPSDGQEDYRRFSPESPSSKMAYFLMDPGRELQFVTALSTEFNLLIGYLFWRSEYPWMMVWEENRQLQAPPWNGETITRGMEFGNTRIPGSARQYFKRPELYATPTFGWLDARAQVTKRYALFLVEIPAGMTGVRDVQLEGAVIVVDAQGVSERLRIPFDPHRFPRPSSD